MISSAIPPRARTASVFANHSAGSARRRISNSVWSWASVTGSSTMPSLSIGSHEQQPPPSGPNGSVSGNELSWAKPRRGIVSQSRFSAGERKPVARQRAAYERICGSRRSSAWSAMSRPSW